MKIINLSKGKTTIVDDEDFERVNQFKWTYFFNPKNKKEYARRGVKRKDRGVKQETVYLHRFIMSAPKDVQIDHKNNDGLDNQKKNLRVCDNSQNHFNQKKRIGGSSEFKGVGKNGNLWRGRIKTIELGSFANEVDAACAYDEMAKIMFGEFALLNFPND